MPRRPGYRSLADRNPHTPYVVVTIFGDIVHAYGPYTRSKSHWVRNKLIRRHAQSGESTPLLVKACQILNPERDANLLCVPRTNENTYAETGADDRDRTTHVARRLLSA